MTSKKLPHHIFYMPTNPWHQIEGRHAKSALHSIDWEREKVCWENKKHYSVTHVLIKSKRIKGILLFLISFFQTFDLLGFKQNRNKSADPHFTFDLTKVTNFTQHVIETYARISCWCLNFTFFRLWEKANGFFQKILGQVQKKMSVLSVMPYLWLQLNLSIVENLYSIHTAVSILALKLVQCTTLQDLLDL